MRKLEFETALSVLDEALHAATEAEKAQDITFYTNLRDYTRKIWNAYLTNSSMQFLSFSSVAPMRRPQTRSR